MRASRAGLAQPAGALAQLPRPDACTQVGGDAIPMGETASGAVPAFLVEAGARPDGAISPDGRVLGTYMHGLFANDGFRAGLLRNLGAVAAEAAWDPADHIDVLARQARMYLDIGRIREIAGV